MTKESQSKPKTRSDSSQTSFSSMQRGLSWQRSFSNEASVQRKPEETPEYPAPGADFDLTRVSSYPQSPAGVQAKLTIGEPGDKYEQEADSVAAEVVNQINSPQFQQQGQAVQRQELSQEEEEEKISPQRESGAIQRQEMPQEDEEEKISPKLMVQRQSGEGGRAATPDVEASINQARGSGQPLADNIREPMEQAFGADFSGVKVHTDAQSDQLNRSIQAKAFTTGQDVFFRQGEYKPGSRGGQELIAHELTHVVQQNSGAVQRSLLPPQQLPQHPATETPSASSGEGVIQRKGEMTGNSQESSEVARPNKTGLPEVLKTGIENLSGYSMDDVRVHYNSDKPAQLQAHAYTQGTDIHVASGQEKHLPHEAWHVVQQKQGRVQPTMQMKGKVNVNDDVGMEREADVMGANAMQIKEEHSGETLQKRSEKGESGAGSASGGVVQRMINLAIDQDQIIYTTKDGNRPPGGIPGGHQGDHTTPFTSLQDQIANAIEGTTLDDAWVNLSETLKVYKTLPGWELSTKWIQETVGTNVEGLLNVKGDINALQTAVTVMLGLRNQIALTSLPKGGHGNAEGTWAGSLQHQERQFQLDKTPQLDKNQVLEYIWKAFDHGRVNRLGDEKRTAILEQHARTMADAYPQLNQSLGIDVKDIVDYYPKKDWINYSPQ